LYDLGFCGLKFTWCNGWEGHAETKERLDKGLANPAWSEIVDVVEVKVLARECSDHNPFLVFFSHTSDIR
jgi:hypothetical protein